MRALFLFEIDKPCIFILGTGRYALENGVIFYSFFFFFCCSVALHSTKVKAKQNVEKKKETFFQKIFFLY